MTMGRIVLLLGLIAAASGVLAQTPGTFTSTGNMTTARVGHTASLLADGRVLIAGGNQGHLPFLASAELYDPATGKFTATGSMTSGRAGHAAILLPDGRVLIVGGSSLASAELYDPSTGAFTATGDMNGNQYPTTATLLPDGRVLIGGGAAGAQLYDPGTGTFTAADIMTGFSTATLLADGWVLIIAGDGYTLYDPRTGKFRLTGPWYGFDLRTVLLMNGEVLMSGGNDDPGPNDSAETYDPSTGILIATGKMTAPRANHSATLLPDGKALIIGGSTWIGWGTGNLYSSCCLSSAELYDTATGLFAATGSMAAGRAGQTATLLNNGNVLIAGGNGDSGVAASAELYHPMTPITAPGLLSLSGDGQGQGAIQHAGTTRIASADDPAVPGEYLSIYLTGLADGSVIPPQVAIGGRLAEITFFGNVPGYPGLNVVNIRMPSGVAPGPAVPVRLTYLGRSSNQVTIGVTIEAALQQAVTAMKTAAGTDSLNFWQWAWYWQNLPPFSGAPAGFGVGGSISPDVMAQITTAGGGDPLRNVSAEQWVSDFRQVIPQ
jgi:Galactose oxidase, central domain